MMNWFRRINCFILAHSWIRHESTERFTVYRCLRCDRKKTLLIGPWAVLDQLVHGMNTKTPVWDGVLVSKGGMATLVERGLADKHCGYNFPTPDGSLTISGTHVLMDAARE